MVFDLIGTQNIGRVTAKSSRQGPRSCTFIEVIRYKNGKIIGCSRMIKKVGSSSVEYVLSQFVKI